VVAAGAPGTARLGAEILRAGGNAVDAAVAAGLATSAFEPALTSLAGGGAMLVVEGATGNASMVDFFPAAPGIGAPPRRRELDFLPVSIDFGSTRQVFHIGRASATVPGTLLGLGTAHRRFGRLPLGELVTPVAAALRTGVVMDAFQARAIRLLAPILQHSEGVRRIFAPGGVLLGEGSTIANPALADLLETAAGVGFERFQREVLAPLLLDEFGPDAGGCLTAGDLDHLRVAVVPPLKRRFRDATVLTTPRPAQGGTSVALMLALLEEVDLAAAGRGSAGHLAALAAAMRTVNEARAFAADPLEAGRLVSWRERCRALQGGDGSSRPPAGGGRGETTHISVIDRDGNAASATLSYGESCGYALGGTGLILNNFMGEEDLQPQGFHTAPPGQRLPTNVCPTAVIRHGELAVLGSGGANRIRSAICQAIVNLVEFGMEPGRAVTAGRLHVEGGVVHAETFDLPDASRLLAEVAHGDEVVVFPQPSLFFGGVHLAVRDSAGRASGAGDPRRDGAVAFS